MNTKILLVDDEPDILYILKTALSRKGYQVYAASDGQAALELYRSEAFDLVISDLRMPQMDGLEVIRRMKLINADAEFIILTGFGTLENAIQALRNERAFDFLLKPLSDINELFITVGQAVEKLLLRRKNRALLSELKAGKAELAKQNRELKRTQEKLETSRNRYSNLYDFAPVGYFTFDREGLILDANLTGFKLLGAEKVDLAQRAFSGFVDAHFHGAFHAHCIATINSGTSRSCELKLVRKDGTPFYALLESTTAPDADGNLDKLWTVVTDITVRKRSEEALRKSEAELRRLSMQLLSAQEEERKRVALDVHDAVGQNLCAIKLKIETILQSIEPAMPHEALQSIKPIVALIQETIEEVRRIEGNLRPPVLDNLGILATISWMCEGFEKICPRLTIEKKIELAEKDVADNLKTVIYRILQVAFNNIVEHSRAQLVQLGFYKTEAGITLKLTDDGQGFDVTKVFSAANPEKGRGLISMRERALFSGGSFSIESQRNRGTSIQVVWLC